MGGGTDCAVRSRLTRGRRHGRAATFAWAQTLTRFRVVACHTPPAEFGTTSGALRDVHDLEGIPRCDFDEQRKAESGGVMPPSRAPCTRGTPRAREWSRYVDGWMGGPSSTAHSSKIQPLQRQKGSSRRAAAAAALANRQAAVATSSAHTHAPKNGRRCAHSLTRTISDRHPEEWGVGVRTRTPAVARTYIWNTRPQAHAVDAAARRSTRKGRRVRRNVAT